MYIIFKDEKSKRSHKAVGIKVFLTFSLCDRRIQIRINTLRRAGKEPGVTHVLACLYNSSIAVPDPNPENQKGFSLKENRFFDLKKCWLVLNEELLTFRRSLQREHLAL
jgi:hypothetical protein